jgi:hypothetical protein
VGPRTRLSFRYKLRGAETLRIQLYSLSNGTHRQLSLAGLEAGRWAEAAADMTALRRPDGSGGPLAADERIDDIQFYANPDAELLIDDIVLYEAAAEGESRPFPKRVVFTGWFDTGKQGQEWPGDFEITPHSPPRSWKCARSIANAETGKPWMRIDLRGRRKLPPLSMLRFRYHLNGAGGLAVALADAAAGRELSRRLEGLRRGEWAEATAVFEAAGISEVDQVIFTLEAGAELLLDDLLLFEPGD